MFTTLFIPFITRFTIFDRATINQHIVVVFILFKNIEGKYLTLPECLEENKESHPNTVFYVNNENEQGQYIRMFKDAGMDAVILKHNIDQPFINQLEQKNKDLKFLSIDSDLSDTFKEDSKEVSEEDKKKDEELNNKLSELFKKALENEQLNVKAEKLKNADISSMITINEDSKRTADMMRMYGMNDPSFAAMGETLVLNLNNSLVNYIIDNPDSENVPMFCRQLYDLARISHAPLTPDAMAEFVSRSNQIMGLLAK